MHGNFVLILLLLLVGVSHWLPLWGHSAAPRCPLRQCARRDVCPFRESSGCLCCEHPAQGLNDDLLHALPPLRRHLSQRREVIDVEGGPERNLQSHASCDFRDRCVWLQCFVFWHTQCEFPDVLTSQCESVNGKKLQM